MHKPRTILAISVATALVALAGCSSTETKNDYVDTVNEIQLSAQDAFTQATSTQPNSPGELVDALRAGEGALEDAVTQLDEVEVPDEAQDGHPDLVAGIDELRRLFADTAAEVESKSGAEAFASVTDLASKGAEIGSEIDRAIDRINQDLGAE